MLSRPYMHTMGHDDSNHIDHIDHIDHADHTDHANDTNYIIDIVGIN